MTETEILIVAVLALLLKGPDALWEAAKFVRRSMRRRSDAWIDRALLIIAAVVLGLMALTRT